MWERTITVGSAGKTFSATGWKVIERLFCIFLSSYHFHSHILCEQMGWAIGPEHFVKHMQTVHANTGYTYPTALQVIILYLALATQLCFTALLVSICIRPCLFLCNLEDFCT